MNEELYEQGFIDKCAEYGVDPVMLLKQAGVFGAVGKGIKAIGRGSKALYKAEKRKVLPPAMAASYLTGVHGKRKEIKGAKNKARRDILRKELEQSVKHDKDLLRRLKKAK
jgi:hypothetical protein